MKQIYILSLLTAPLILYTPTNHSAPFEKPHYAQCLKQFTNSNDHHLLESVRKLDIAVGDFAHQEWTKEKANQFCINGWATLLAAAALAHVHSHSISPELKKYLTKKLDSYVPTKHTTPTHASHFYTVNQRQIAKDILMYPHAGHYLPWVPLKESDDCIKLCNKELQNTTAHAELYNNKLNILIGEDATNPRSEKNVINKLHHSQFAKVLEERGYKDFKLPRTTHITVYDSNVIANIKNQLVKKYGEKEGKQTFTNIFDSFCKKHSTVQSLRCNNLMATFVEDYAPFEEIVALGLEDEPIHQFITDLEENLQQHLPDIQLPRKPQGSYHLTCSVRYREKDDAGFKNIYGVGKAAGINL